MHKLFPNFGNGKGGEKWRWNACFWSFNTIRGKGTTFKLWKWAVLSASVAQPKWNACFYAFNTIFKVLACANDRRLDDKLYQCVWVGAATSWRESERERHTGQH